MSYQYIETQDALTELCAQLQDSPWLTLDTEFIREKTYYPQLCLIQIANTEHVACIDPLALDDLTPLLDLLYNPAITKVLHSARQDLEILQQLKGEPPTPIFDTQVAATLLGQGEQVGYGNLVKLILDVDLDKAHSRTDWSQRPLSSDQLDYAADDVRYLRDVYLQQRQKLEALGRLTWLDDDFAQLSDPALYSPPLGEAWSKLKGLNRLKGVQLAMVQKLAQWREGLARERNLPKRWLLSDDLIIEVARQRPLSEDKLRRIRGMDDKIIQRYGKMMLQLVEEARSLPAEQWPQLQQRPRLSSHQEALVDILVGVVKLSAAQHQLSPNALASRKEIEQLLTGSPEAPLLHGWRYELCGQSLQSLLSGKQCITIEADHVHITDV
ncbi:MAG: ribonuclease D [Gammaproteobacteria bacterium]|nr:ribonuclease D [Gammaproteobacteria bacterium]